MATPPISPLVSTASAKYNVHPETDAFALTHYFLSVSLSLPVLNFERDSRLNSGLMAGVTHHLDLCKFDWLQVFVLVGPSQLGIIQWDCAKSLLSGAVHLLLLLLFHDVSFFPSC